MAAKKEKIYIIQVYLSTRNRSNQIVHSVCLALLWKNKPFQRIFKIHFLPHSLPNSLPPSLTLSLSVPQSQSLMVGPDQVRATPGRIHHGPNTSWASDPVSPGDLEPYANIVRLTPLANNTWNHTAQISSVLKHAHYPKNCHKLNGTHQQALRGEKWVVRFSMFPVYFSK